MKSQAPEIQGQAMMIEDITMEIGTFQFFN